MNPRTLLTPDRLDTAGRVLTLAAGWTRRGRRWVGGLLLVAGIVALGSDITHTGLLLLAGWVAPAVGLGVWQVRHPVSFERVVDGPARRYRRTVLLRRAWPDLARACGWVQDRTTAAGGRITSTPRLEAVQSDGVTTVLKVRTRPGQTLADLEKGVPALAATLGAVSYRTSKAGARLHVLRVELVMADLLATGAVADVPAPACVGDPVGTGVVIGRRHNGAPAALDVLGRHTLVVGRSGAGKGSWMWGLVASLAPAVPADIVRLCVGGSTSSAASS